VAGKKSSAGGIRLSDRLVGETLTEYRSRLAPYTEQPALEATLLLAFATGLTKEWVLAHPEAVLTVPQAETAESLIQKRIEGQPLPYLIGRWEFYGLEFKISPHVLIPRPETEILVETALEWLRTNPDRTHALDVGTGSGCIGITLAFNVHTLMVIGGDISAEALVIARQNAEFHEVSERTAFYQGDLAHPLSGSFDLICANLPYIPSQMLAGLDVVKTEPVQALDGGPDGMLHISRLLEDAKRITASGALLLFEIEAGQGKTSQMAARELFPDAKIAVLPDLAGLDRVLKIQLPA
jgi:release factor glutamine methyltransferase